MNRTILCIAAAAGLWGTIALAEDLFVNVPAVDIRAGKGAVPPIVGTATKGTPLQGLGHEGPWVKVQATLVKPNEPAKTIEGYVYERSLTFQKPDTTNLVGVSAASMVTEGNAGKGFGPDVGPYSKTKGLSTKTLQALMDLRKKVSVAEFDAFTAEGKVGTGK